KLLEGDRLVIAGDLEEPRLAVEHERPPDEARHPRLGGRLAGLGVARLAGWARLVAGLGLGTVRGSLRSRGSRARQGQLTDGPTWAQGQAQETKKREEIRPIHRAKCRGAGEKGEARPRLAAPRVSPKNPRLPRLAPLKRPTYIRPDWPVWAQDALNRRKSG